MINKIKIKINNKLINQKLYFKRKVIKFKKKIKLTLKKMIKIFRRSNKIKLKKKLKKRRK